MSTQPDSATSRQCGQHGMPYSMWHGLHGCHPDALEHEPMPMGTPPLEMPVQDTPIRPELNTRITPDLLRQVRGRSEQYEMFTAMYPEGVEVTREWCIKHADLFDFRWGARHLLTDEGCSYFWGPAQVAYRSRRLRGDPSYATKLAETFAATVQQFGLAEDPR